MIKQRIEAILLAAGEPVSLQRLQVLFNESESPLSTTELRTLLEEMRADYTDHGFELTEVASGYTFQIRTDFAPWVSKFWQERPPRYSRVMLETLAIIVYRQPITRAEIEDIRGVTVNSTVIKTLQDHGWIRSVGHKDVPGKPELLATTKQFLDHFNLKSLEQLPALTDIENLVIDECSNQEPVENETQNHNENSKQHTY